VASPFNGDFGVSTFDSTYQGFAEETKRAPWWPIVLGIAFMAVSFVLIYLERSASDTTMLTLAVLGYCLTPLATSAVLLLAMQMHRRLSTADRYDSDSGSRLVRICSFIAIAGFIVAIPHVVQIAGYFSLVFAPGVN